MSAAASHRYQNIPRCRAAFERTLQILREFRIGELYIRERSRQISYISDTTCEPISRQTGASRIEDRELRIEDRGSRIEDRRSRTENRIAHDDAIRDPRFSILDFKASEF